MAKSPPPSRVLKTIPRNGGMQLLTRYFQLFTKKFFAQLHIKNIISTFAAPNGI